MRNGQQIFADRLRESIAARNETQASVAAGINVSPQAVGKWVTGGRIDDENLKALSGYLGVNWLWLRYGEEAIEELDRWVADRERNYERSAALRNWEAVLEQVRVGLWELDLLSGKFDSCGPAFFSPRPSNLSELRLAIDDKDVPAFDAFVARVTRSARDEPGVQIEVQAKCSKQAVSIVGRRMGEDDALKIGGLMQDTTTSRCQRL